LERLEITFKNGNKCTWGKTDFNDYTYDGKLIIIKKGDKWVGIYPVDALLSFVYFDK
jgi:hypothetical protein